MKACTLPFPSPLFPDLFPFMFFKASPCVFKGIFSQVESISFASLSIRSYFIGEDIFSFFFAIIRLYSILFYFNLSIHSGFIQFTSEKKYYFIQFKICSISVLSILKILFSISIKLTRNRIHYFSYII